MTMSMSTEAPITLRDTIVLSGNLSSHSGSGIQSSIHIFNTIWCIYKNRSKNLFIFNNFSI